jgi:hypothetical protein
MTTPAAPNSVRLKYGLSARYVLRGEADLADPKTPPRSAEHRRAAAAARSRARAPNDPS